MQARRRDALMVRLVSDLCFLCIASWIVCFFRFLCRPSSTRTCTMFIITFLPLLSTQLRPPAALATEPPLLPLACSLPLIFSILPRLSIRVTLLIFASITRYV